MLVTRLFGLHYTRRFRHLYPAVPDMLLNIFCAIYWLCCPLFISYPIFNSFSSKFFPIFSLINSEMKNYSIRPHVTTSWRKEVLPHFRYKMWYSACLYLFFSTELYHFLLLESTFLLIYCLLLPTSFHCSSIFCSVINM